MTFAADVPADLRTIIEPIVADFAAACKRRSESAKKAAKTREKNSRARHAAKLVAWHTQVRDELAGVADIAFVRSSGAVPDDPGSPEPSVPAGTPHRKARIAAAQTAIVAAYRRLFDARKQD